MSSQYGIGEIFGRSFSSLSSKDVRMLASTDHRKMDCPFKGGKCSKAGGVCSIGCYSEADGLTHFVEGTLTSTCPNRFYESDIAFSWVGRTMIGSSNPKILKELPFLLDPNEDGKSQAVGRIDMVLVNDENEKALRWCALEMQAVYFSGSSISNELKALRKYHGEGIPLPKGRRRPDFRSSGSEKIDAPVTNQGADNIPLGEKDGHYC